MEFGRGKSSSLGQVEAEAITNGLLSTPGHSINRLIVVKSGKIILDRSK